MPRDDPVVTVQLFAVVREHITFDKYSFPPHKLSCLDLHCLSIVICARLFFISIISSTKASNENHEPDIVYFHSTMGQKSVLITGSSEGGIGDALAKTFHKKGLRVFATARNLTKVQHLKELGLEILPLDVTDDASIKQAVENVKAATGGTLDILVNNSGGGYNMPLLDSEVAIAKKMFDVNVFALIAVTQAFSPLLIASKGTVVNIGSIVGKFPLPWQGYYNASKAAVNLLSDQLRIELSPFNVKVVNVVTGSVLTRFMENLASPPRLPPNSLYSPAKKEVEELMLGELALENAMKVEVYAEGVASNALKSNPKKIQWIGGETFLIWLGDTFGWATIWDLILPRATNLGLVQRKIRTTSQPISK